MNYIQSDILIESGEKDDSIRQSMKMFWYAFLGSSLLTVLNVYGVTGTFFFNCARLVCVCVIFISVIQNIHIRFDSGFFKFVFIAYVLWQAVVVYRGFAIDREVFIMMYGNDEYFFYAVIPFVIFFMSDNLFNYKYMINFLMKFNYIFLILLPLILLSVITIRYKYNFDYIIVYFSICSGFLLLLLPFLSTKQKYIVLFTFIISLLFSVIYARRNLVFSLSGFAALSFILYYTHHAKNGIDKRLFLGIISVFVLLFAYSIYESFKGTLFSSFDERMFEDSRSIVTLMFIEDMSPDDWIIGKGMDGSYYCPGIDPDENIEYRRGVETGFLSVILKGGIISLSLFLIISIYAIFNGLFRTRNGFTKAAAMVNLFWLVEMYPSGQPSFNIRYLLVWICIGICTSAKIRQLSDEDIKCIFNK